MMQFIIYIDERVPYRYTLILWEWLIISLDLDESIPLFFFLFLFLLCRNIIISAFEKKYLRGTIEYKKMWGLTLQTHKPKLAKIIGQNVIQSILKERNPLRFIRARHPRLALG